jgi:glutamate decarboxylase
LQRCWTFVLTYTNISLETFKSIKEALKFSVNSWNPRFMDKLYAGTNPIGVISELLIATLNPNAHVYHVSPVLTMMEIHVTQAAGQLLGMGDKAGGLLCPGGSASNQLAMVTARNTLFPSIKDTGYLPRPFNPSAEYGKLKIFTSQHSHYSIDKAAQVMGLGVDNIVKVPIDQDGKMQIAALGK